MYIQNVSDVVFGAKIRLLHQSSNKNNGEICIKIPRPPPIASATETEDSNKNCNRHIQHTEMTRPKCNKQQNVPVKT